MTDFKQSIKEAEAEADKLMASVTEEDGTIKIGGKEISIKGAFPLLLGDWRKLGNLGLIDKDNNVKAGDPDSVAKLLLHLVKKVDASVTEEQLDAVPLSKISRLFLYARKTLKEGDGSLHPTKSGS